MQFDKTLIVVRERSVSDVLDLALQVWRIHAWPLTIAMCLGVVPLAIVNHLLTYWMVAADPDLSEWGGPAAGLARFVWTMGLLIVIEAPLASMFATAYLGKAMFVPAPAIRDVVREVLPFLWPTAGFHLLLRGVLPALLLAAVNHAATYSGEEVLLVLLTGVVLVLRAAAPFVNEILLLEKNPLRPDGPRSLTAGRRSAVLHGSHRSNLVAQGFVMAGVAVLLTMTLFGTLLCLRGIFLDDWSLSARLFVLGAPLAMWTTAEYMTVVRFLSYLDLRIRHEGWEVELRMRAEGARLAGQIR